MYNSTSSYGGCPQMTPSYALGGYIAAGRGYFGSGYSGSDTYGSSMPSNIYGFGDYGNEIAARHSDESTVTSNSAEKITNTQEGTHFSADNYLDLSIKQPIVGCADEVKEHVENAFKAVTGCGLPHDLKIHIGTTEQIKTAHPGKWSDGILGFCLNRNGFGISEIFVRQDRLDRTLLTIGHEIGHALTPPLPNPIDEEAKAFAFSLAWMEAIHENDIAGLKRSVHPQPADNGVHDVAFNFVKKLGSEGISAIEIFKELVRRTASIERVVEQLVR